MTLGSVKPRTVRPKTKEAAGPYRDQSSDPKIRSKATKREHRKVAVKAPSQSSSPASSTPSSNPFAVTPPTAPRKGQARRQKAGVGKLVRAVRQAEKTIPSAGKAISEAKLGVRPPVQLKKTDPLSYRQAEKAYNEYIRSKENLGEPEDLTNLITFGVGGGLVGGATKKIVETATKEVGERIAKEGAEDVAKSVMKKGSESARKKVVEKVERIKSTPERVKTAPSRARASVSTKEARKATGKAVAKNSARHPVRTGSGLALATPSGTVPGDVGDRARALAEGTAKAVVNDPLKVAGTTGRGVLGLFTGPLAVAGAGVESAKQGSTEPLEATGSELIKGTVDMAKKLGSGDEKVVQETTEDETGLTPFIPAGALGRRLKETEAYRGARTGVRDVVEGRRARVRGKRIDAQKAAQEGGQWTRTKKPKQPVLDSRNNNEPYVVRPAGKLIEKSRERRATSRDVTRGMEAGKFWGSKDAKPIVDKLKKSPLVHGSRVRIGARNEPDAGDALRFAAIHGLRPDEKSGVAAAREALDSYDKVEHGKVPADRILDRHGAQFILDNPKIWKDKAFWDAVSEAKRVQEGIGTSERNRWLAAADNIVNPSRRREGKPPVLKPEEQIRPETERLLSAIFPDHTGRWSREDAYDVVDALRAEAAKAGPGKGSLKAKARRLEKTLDGLMRPPGHGGPAKGVATTKAQPWIPGMVDRFVREMTDEYKERGLEPPIAYSRDVMPSGARELDRPREYGQPGEKVWPNTGKAASSGNAESGFESFLRHSIFGPRMLRSMNQTFSRAFERGQRKVNGKIYVTEKELERLVNTHQLPEGTIPVRTQMIKGVLEGEHSIDPEDFAAMVRGEIESGQRLAKSSGQELREAIQALSDAKGHKYALIDGATVRELVEQMEKLPAASRAAAKVSNFSTRAILNSPAYLLVQGPQEMLPMLAAAGKNIKRLPRAISTVRAVRQMDPEILAQVKAVAGSNAGIQGAPTMAQLGKMGVLNPIAAAAPKTVWRHAWELINGSVTGRLDRARGGWMREVAAAAKVEGDFNAWRKGSRNIYYGMEKAIKDMEGMTHAQRLAYTASHPKLGDRLMEGMHEWMGNWNAFTAFEKQFAPVTIFYAFQRYSALWTLYHFPLNHPVVATALTMLGEANANRLEELAASQGGEVTNPLDYTIPVVSKSKGPVTKDNSFVLPFGQRTFSGLGAVQTAIATDEPAAIFGALQPAVAITIQAANGKDPFGQDIDENGFAYAARQAIAQSPVLRLLGADDVGKPPKGTVSKAFEKLDKNAGTRSFALPFIGQSGAQFALQTTLEHALKESAANGSEAREKAARKAASEGKVLPDKTREAMERKAEHAGKQIDRVLTTLGLADESDEAYKLFKQGFYKPSAKERLEREMGLTPAPSKQELEEEMGLTPAPTKEQLEIEMGLR